MQATADSLAFAPPPEPAAIRGFALAVIAHLLLLIALSGLITWQSDDRSAAVEAELWSNLPQEAAPPPPPPQPEVTPPVVQPAPPPPVTKQPDIAVEREKKKREEQKLAEERKQKEELAKKDKQKLEQLRKENLARMMSEAAGNGAPTSKGTAQKSAGPSDGYAGRIRARVKPNIVFMDDVPGNPSAEVEVRMAPDGTIVSRNITKPSGVKSWDDAVLRALDKTEVLPRDVDGRVHTPLIIEFRLRG